MHFAERARRAFYGYLTVVEHTAYRAGVLFVYQQQAAFEGAYQLHAVYHHFGRPSVGDSALVRVELALQQARIYKVVAHLENNVLFSKEERAYLVLVV